MRYRNTAAVIMLALVLSACQRTGGGFLPSREPAPLAPAPVAGVDASQLPPPGADGFPQAPEAPQTVSPEEVAALEASAPPVNRESLVGRWTVASSGDSCDVFLALTQWTGGYRAASRGCVGEAAAIAAWNVEGNQVLLTDDGGNQIARLFQAGEERYSGSTRTGQPINLSR